MQAEGVVLNVARDALVRRLTVGADRDFYGQKVLISPSVSHAVGRAFPPRSFKHGDRIHHGAVNTSPPLAVAMTGMTDVLPTV
jgi:hypothetical protein